VARERGEGGEGVPGVKGLPTPVWAHLVPCVSPPPPSPPRGGTEGGSRTGRISLKLFMALRSNRLGLFPTHLPPHTHTTGGIHTPGGSERTGGGEGRSLTPFPYHPVSTATVKVVVFHWREVERRGRRRKGEDPLYLLSSLFTLTHSLCSFGLLALAFPCHHPFQRVFAAGWFSPNV
jgi:hypothetical protein